MKKLQWVALVPACILAVSGVSAFADYKVMSGGVKDGGSISGRVTFNGTAPAPEILKVDEDKQVCGGDRPSEALLVSGSGGIENVVLSIDSISAGKAWNFPKEFKYDQKKCTFVPHIMLIKPNMAGAVVNSDGVGHNFHTISKGVYNINKKIQPGSELSVSNSKIRRPGIVRAKCDIHGWMSGYWFVAETPYAVLSDKEGNFSIKDIPPGSYTVKVWHEKLGESEQKVVVKKGETTKLNIALKL